MRIEKIILAIAAVMAGLFVAGIAFYIYQTTKTLSPSSIKTITLKPSPPSGPDVLLTVDNPADESVTSSRVISINGKTDPQATIIVTTDSLDTVISPTSTGAYSLTLTLAPGENKIVLMAVMPNGQETQKNLTFSVESDNF